jgi:hypothetical protein
MVLNELTEEKEISKNQFQILQTGFPLLKNAAAEKDGMIVTF